MSLAFFFLPYSRKTFKKKFSFKNLLQLSKIIFIQGFSERGGFAIVY